MGMKECLYCKKEFYVPKCRDEKAKYCSMNCKYEHKKEIGITYEERICIRCGSTFKSEPRFKSKYCSPECYHLTKRNREERECINCGETFGVKKSIYMNCCSMKCRLEFQSKNKVDKTAYSSPEWKRMRMRVLVRDDFKCVKCNKDTFQLHVHHKVSRKNGGADSLDNLETLCIKCHRLEHLKINKER